MRNDKSDYSLFGKGQGLDSKTGGLQRKEEVHTLTEPLQEPCCFTLLICFHFYLSQLPFPGLQEKKEKPTEQGKQAFKTSPLHLKLRP